MRGLLGILCASLIAQGALVDLASADLLDARRGDRNLYSRLVVLGARIDSPADGAPKSYTPDMLTVDQLVGCLKTAKALDQSRATLAARRTALGAKIEDLVRRSEAKGRRPNPSQSQKLLVTQEKLDADIRRREDDLAAYQANCTRKFYTDDLKAALKIVEAK